MWDPGGEVRICTDSQSVLRRLAIGPGGQTDRVGEEIWRLLNTVSRAAHITLQFVPGHAGIEGNEEADELARRGSRLPQWKTPIDMASAEAVVRREAKRKWLEGAGRDGHWGGDISWERGKRSICLREQGLTRAEAVALARLRSGHSMILRAYAKRVKLSPEATCLDCGEEDEDLKHLFRCTSKTRELLAVFGCRQLLPEEAFREPRRVADFLRMVGRV